MSGAKVIESFAWKLLLEDFLRLFFGHDAIEFHYPSKLILAPIVSRSGLLAFIADPAKALKIRYAMNASICQRDYMVPLQRHLAMAFQTK